MKVTKSVFGRLFILIASLALVAACSSGGGSTGEDDTDTGTDAVTDLDNTEPDVVDDSNEDVPPEVEDIIEGKDQPDIDVPDEIEQPDEIEEVDPDTEETIEPDVEPEIETCTLTCQGDEDCVGTFPGETTFCLNEKCLWDEECGTFQCQLKRDPADCCDTDEDCVDDNECTINETCLTNHTCSFETSPDCCTNTTIRHLNFDDGQLPPATKMQIIDSDQCEEVTWQIAGDPCGNGNALYLGDPECETYYCGQKYDCQPVEEIPCSVATQDTDCPGPLAQCDPGTNTCMPDPESKRVNADVFLPEVLLPQNSLVQISFRLWADTEPEVPGSPYDFDLLTLTVEMAGVEQEVAFDTTETKSTNGSCVVLAADLSQYAGQAPDLRFSFDTNDGLNNNYGGIYLDDIRISTYCDSCTGSAQCMDDEKCTVDSCIAFVNKQSGEGFCANIQDDPFCWECDTADDCLGHGPNPEDPTCWPATCTGEGLCEWAPNPACCNEDDLEQFWTEGFEGGQLPDDFTLSNQGGTVVWQLLDGYGAPEESGDLDQDTFGLYFGDPETNSYDCGSIQCMGEFTTPEFDLADVAETAFVKLSFMLNMSTEFDLVPPEAYPENNATTTQIDMLYVEVVKENGQTTQVWNSDSIYGSTKGDFKPQWADLSGFKGETIRLRFRFDTGFITPANNDFGGIWLDELKVESVCDPVCSSDMQCETVLDCVLPTCVEGHCGTETIEDCCTETVNPNCDDGDPCTNDACDFDSQTCTHEFNGQPECCTAYPEIYMTDYETVDSDEWTVPESGDDCGNGLCEGEETCVTCPSDCNQCLVSWNLSETRFVSEGHSLYFGNPETSTYDNGSDVAYGQIMSQAIQLPAYGIPKVSFQLWLDTEHTDVYETFIEPNQYDNLNLWIQTANSVDAGNWSAPQLVWNSMAWDMKGSTYDPSAGAVIWKPVEVGITDAAAVGKAVRFIFEFDGFESGIDNDNFEGAYIDDFTVGTMCDTDYECLSAFECAETNPADPHCTIEMCDNGSCVSTPNTMKQGCCQQDIVGGADFDFDGPCNMQSWSATPPSAAVKWQVDNAQNHTASGQCAMYFGNTQTHTYDNPGFPVSGLATSPAVNVTGLTEVHVGFWMWADLADTLYFLDMLEFKADYVPFEGQVPAGSEVNIWQKPCSPLEDTECLTQPPTSPCDMLGCETFPNSEWNYYYFTLDLTAEPFASWDWSIFPNQLMVFKFEFNSFDGTSNDGAGIYIDDFKVQTVCE